MKFGQRDDIETVATKLGVRQRLRNALGVGRTYADAGCSSRPGIAR